MALPFGPVCTQSQRNGPNRPHSIPPDLSRKSFLPLCPRFPRNEISLHRTDLDIAFNIGKVCEYSRRRGRQCNTTGDFPRQVIISFFAFEQLNEFHSAQSLLLPPDSVGTVSNKQNRAGNRVVLVPARFRCTIFYWQFLASSTAIQINSGLRTSPPT